MSIFGSDKHPADIEVFMLRFSLAGWNGMNIEVEDAWRCKDQPFDTGFFEGFALCNGEYVFLSVAVTAEGQPFAEFAVVMQKSLRSVRADQHHTASEVGGKG